MATAKSLHYHSPLGGIISVFGKDTDTTSAPDVFLLEILDLLLSAIDDSPSKALRLSALVMPNMSSAIMLLTGLEIYFTHEMKVFLLCLRDWVAIRWVATPSPFSEILNKCCVAFCLVRAFIRVTLRSKHFTFIHLLPVKSMPSVNAFDEIGKSKLRIRVDSDVDSHIDSDPIRGTESCES
ncbi:hypothetical protein B0H19DRAFT_1082473 [Mycena capillaripes]|nr:hypothetical protein B0H19DRAFT_1082473 [Mycena capillaripes]